jgi:hypothetical protein
MPNNSDARRNKRAKKKNRREETSPSPPIQVTEESVESFISHSASDSGFQEEDDEVTWESAAGEASLDNSLSSFRTCERYEHEIDYRLWDIGSSKSL